jgi:hypothetical protein
MDVVAVLGVGLGVRYGYSGVGSVLGWKDF